MAWRWMERAILKGGEMLRQLLKRQERRRIDIGEKPTLYCTGCGKKKYVYRQSRYDESTGDEIKAHWESWCFRCRGPL